MKSVSPSRYVRGLVLTALLVFGFEALAPDGLIEPVALSRRMLARALLEQEAGVEIREGEAGPVFAVSDPARFREVISDLLVRCARALADADRQAARQLVRQWMEPGTWPQRQAVAERARGAGLRSRVACILPKLKPLRGGRPGHFVDATISHSEQFAHQLLRIARY